jgi:hypothetical protein
VCFGMRGIVLCKSRDVEIVQDAAGVFNTGAQDNGGVGGMMGYIYSSSGDFLVQDSTCEFCWLMNTTRCNHPTQLQTPSGGKSRRN